MVKWMLNPCTFAVNHIGNLQELKLVSEPCLFFCVLAKAPSRLRRRNLKHSFFRLGLPSILICQENRTFRNGSSNQRNLKTPALRFRLDGKHFENRAFRKRWRHVNLVISLPEFSSNANLKWQVIDAFSNFSSVVCTENMVHFQRENIVFKFSGKGFTLILLSFGPVWGSNTRPPAQHQSGVLSELTRRPSPRMFGYMWIQRKVRKQRNKNDFTLCH